LTGRLKSALVGTATVLVGCAHRGSRSRPYLYVRDRGNRGCSRVGPGGCGRWV